MVIDKRLCRKCSHTINIGLIKEAKPNGRQWIKANLPDVSHCVVTPNSFKRRVHHPGVYQFIGSNNHRQGLHLASILAILQVIVSLCLIIHLCNMMDSLERTMMQMWNLRHKLMLCSDITSECYSWQQSWTELLLSREMRQYVQSGAIDVRFSEPTCPWHLDSFQISNLTSKCMSSLR